MTSQIAYSSEVVVHVPVDGELGRPWDNALLHARPVLRRDTSRSLCPRSDQHLVDAARAGCPTAFAELWSLYSRRIYLTTLKIVKNPHDAEDALQDAFLRAFQAIESFEDRANFYTWLTRIAINSALGILRTRRRKRETSLDLMSQPEDGQSPVDFKDTAPGPEQDFTLQQQHASLAQAIQRLPLGLREVIHTLIAEDCTVKEVARRLDISYAAAKSRLYRARAIISSSVAARHDSRTPNAMPRHSVALPASYGH